MRNLNQIVFVLGWGNITGEIIIYKSTYFQRDFYEKFTDEIINKRIVYYLSQKKKKMVFIKVEKIFSIIKLFILIFPNSDEGLINDI